MPNANVSVATRAAQVLTRVGRRDQALVSLRSLIAMTDKPAARKKLLDHYRSLLADSESADELEQFRSQLDDEWKKELPFAPIDYHILLGERPTRRVDLAGIAPISDLLAVELLREQTIPTSSDSSPAAALDAGTSDEDSGDAANVSPD